jgi:hypothetical protein
MVKRANTRVDNDGLTLKGHGRNLTLKGERTGLSRTSRMKFDASCMQYHS